MYKPSLEMLMIAVWGNKIIINVKTGRMFRILGDNNGSTLSKHY